MVKVFYEVRLAIGNRAILYGEKWRECDEEDNNLGENYKIRREYIKVFK